MTRELPTVTAVVATAGTQPVLLREALDGVLGQDYAGEIELIVVFDHVAPDDLDDIQVGPRRLLRVVQNERPRGLAGGRNTGIMGARGELVAFCDDDDRWLPTKISEQVELLAQVPGAGAVASGIRIETGERTVVRSAPERTTTTDLLRSRIAALHPSSFMVARERLVDVGMVDEDMPSAYGEDYDLLIRLSRTGPVVAVARPLVDVGWNRASMFSQNWSGIAAGLEYLLEKHPEFAAERRGRARVTGQIAFASAAARLPGTWGWARGTLRAAPLELRAWAALVVGTRVVPASVLLRVVNATGRGL